MSKIAYQYEYQTDVKDIEFTPHKRNAVERSVGRENGENNTHGVQVTPHKRSAVWGPKR